MKINRLFLNIYNFFLHGTTDFFVHFNLEPSAFCDKKCVYCPQKTFGLPTRTSHLMKMSTVETAIQSLKAIKFIGNIVWSGYGEPSFNKELPAFCLYTRQNLLKCRQVIYTNAFDVNVLTDCFPFIDRVVVSSHDTPDRAKEFVSYCKQKKMPCRLNLINEFEGAKATRRGLVPMFGTPDEYKPTWPICPLNDIFVSSDGAITYCCHDVNFEDSIGHIDSINWRKAWKWVRVKRSLIQSGNYKIMCSQCYHSTRDGFNF